MAPLDEVPDTTMYAIVPGTSRMGCFAVLIVKNRERPVTVALPMTHLVVEATLQGRMAAVTVRQEFDNRMTGALDLPEVEYIYPTDENAMVYAVSATTPERTIRAALKGKEEAKEEYEAAKAAGQFALHAHSQSIRETSVSLGNVKAGWTIAVEFKYAVLLPVKTGSETTVEWWLPTYLTPRFGEDTVTGRQVISKTTQINVSVRVVNSSGCKVSPSDGGGTFSMSGQDTVLSFDKTGDGFQSELRVTVVHAKSLPDKLLCAPVPATEGRAGGYALLYTGNLSFPHEEFNLDLAVIVDRSGSMYQSFGDHDNYQRQRIHAVADAIKVLATCLRKGDRISLAEFGSAGRERVPVPLQDWSNQSKAHLLQCGEAMTQHDLGGTEPYQCLATAIKHLTEAGTSRHRLKAIMFLGDGDLGGRNQELFKNISTAYKDHGIFTSVLAIGHGCNTALLKQMAEQGRGLFEHVLSGKDMLQTVGGMTRAARELPVHDVEFAPVYTTQDERTSASADGGWQIMPLSVSAWLKAAFQAREAAPAPPVSQTVVTSLKTPSSQATVTPVSGSNDVMVPPVALFAMSPPALRPSTAITLAMIVPDRPAAVRVTAVFKVWDGANKEPHLNRVSMDVAVDDVTSWAPLPPYGEDRMDDEPRAPATADVTAVPPAVVALVGTTLVRDTLRELESSTYSGRGDGVRAAERGLTRLAVQLFTNCRLTSWIAVDREGRPVEDRDGQPLIAEKVAQPEVS